MVIGMCMDQNNITRIKQVLNSKGDLWEGICNLDEISVETDNTTDDDIYLVFFKSDIVDVSWCLKKQLDPALLLTFSSGNAYFIVRAHVDSEIVTFSASPNLG